MSSMREAEDTVMDEKVSDISEARTREWWRWEEAERTEREKNGKREE